MSQKKKIQCPHKVICVTPQWYKNDKREYIITVCDTNEHEKCTHFQSLEAMLEPLDEASRKEQIRTIIRSLRENDPNRVSPYMQSLMQYDPYIELVKLKLLLVNSALSSETERIKIIEQAQKTLDFKPIELPKSLRLFFDEEYGFRTGQKSTVNINIGHGQKMTISLPRSDIKDKVGNCVLCGQPSSTFKGFGSDLCKEHRTQFLERMQAKLQSLIEKVKNEQTKRQPIIIDEEMSLDGLGRHVK